MGDSINPKPFTKLEFTLTAGQRLQYETAQGAVIFFAEGPGIPPGGLLLQLDEEPEFRAVVGDFLRVQSFDKLRLINATGVTFSGVILVSSYPDFLFFNYPRGL
jgi:hypothetical protein